MSGALPPVAPLVVRWQAEHGRSSLPWQCTRDPYRVWLSEIMLQQTQVATVLDYYARFLARFPDVHALAAAPPDDVLALWSGLGYYSRARNLHRCAQQVVQVHGGRFPATVAELSALPGIGRSTAGAIAAFCFGQRAPILDANVRRVLTRLLGFGGDLAQAAQERALWQHAQDLLPTQQLDESMPRYTQGMMDLGAMVCLPRQPRCEACPLQAHCVARAKGTPEQYPVRTRKLVRKAQAWWLEQGGRYWVLDYKSNHLGDAIHVRGRGDAMVPLSSLVSVQESVSPRELNHFGQRRSATITAMATYSPRSAAPCRALRT